MSKEDLKVKPAEQEVKEEDLKEVNGGKDCSSYCDNCQSIGPCVWCQDWNCQFD